MAARRLFVLFPVLLALVVSAPPAAAQPSPKPVTPIEHFVVLMQAGHSFDNYFGTYPGADGLPPDTCMKLNSGGQSLEDCVRPFHLENPLPDPLDHSESIQRRQLHEGKMDGFVDVFRRQGRDGTVAMGYYDDRDIPYYWNVADEYTLFDRFFSSARAGSRLNHFYWVAGVPTPNNGSERVPPEGYGDIPTIFDRLEAKGVSWKFYVENYDPTNNLREPSVDGQSSQRTKVPLLNYGRFVDDPRLFGKIVDLSEYDQDLANGTLPAVSYVVTSGASETAPARVQAGQRLVNKMTRQLIQSDYWSKSAFLLTYDGWGGWYDHVIPPTVDEHGYGFRVPALMISPYSQRGEVNHAELDYSAIVRFIQQNWSLEPLVQRPASGDGLMGAFDFTSPPRPAELLALDRVTADARGPSAVVYGFYGGAFGVLVLVLVAGLVFRARVRSWFSEVAL
jgi:phospholipase C